MLLRAYPDTVNQSAIRHIRVCRPLAGPNGRFTAAAADEQAKRTSSAATSPRLAAGFTGRSLVLSGICSVAVAGWHPVHEIARHAVEFACPDLREALANGFSPEPRGCITALAPPVF